MKLTLTTDRKLLKIDGEDFSLTLNGKSNADYKKILDALGVEITWVEPKVDVEASPASPPDEELSPKLNNAFADNPHGMRVLSRAEAEEYAKKL